MHRKTVFLITCEHATSSIPKGFTELFKDRFELLNSHRAYDQYALGLAKSLASALRAPCFSASISRLLIDQNRSLHNPALWSEVSRKLGKKNKQYLLTTYYQPFRSKVELWLEGQFKEGRNVIHFSVHSFAPFVHGIHRNAEIGLLYDPKRIKERTLCRHWKKMIRTTMPQWRVRLNYPYLGSSDCHQNNHRKQYSTDLYQAVELEINQSLPRAYSMLCVKKVLKSSLFKTLADFSLEIN